MNDNKTRSHWREFEFMLHQLQQAVEPKIGLEQSINYWGDICSGLSEAVRKRRPQGELNKL
jgi:hypothetical protein